jgi:NTE family protein
MPAQLANRPAMGTEQARARLASAGTYAEWSAAALAADAESGAEAWKAREDDGELDASDIRRRRDALRLSVGENDAQGLLFELNEGIHGNMGGMGNPALYGRARFGTKHLIADYVAAIVEALDAVAHAPEAEITFGEKLDFFERAALCYGRSALMLSGGGGRIYFHHGVVDALLDEGLLPDVMSGSSAGGWLCAVVGSRTDGELAGFLETKRYDFGVASSFLGTALGARRMRSDGRLQKVRKEVIEALVGDLTFAEAHEHSGRMINISVASPDRHHRARLLNAITSPNVTLRSACDATSCLPQFQEPAMLQAKDRSGRIVPYLPNQRWIDGALADDLPLKRLQRLYAVNHTIVSQINPMSLVTPFLRPDPKSGKDGPLYQSSNLLFGALREGAKLAQRSLWAINRSAADAWLEYFYRFAEQTVSGDVTIEASFDTRSLEHSVFNFADDTEISCLIMEGRRATWPRIEQIRNATAVSKALDAHLVRLEHEAVERRDTRLRRSIGPSWRSPDRPPASGARGLD